MDGCDFLASYDALKWAFAYCRERKGPALVHAHVVRPYSHSLSDDDRLYRTEEERKKDAELDPLGRMEALLLEHGLLDAAGLEALKAEVEAELIAATDAALASPQPDAGELFAHVYSPTSTRPRRPSTPRPRPRSPGTRRRWST